MVEINIRDAFRDLFGYEAPETFALEKASNRLESSKLGSAYYETDILGREFFLPVKIDGMLIPFAVMSMNWKKIIQKTHMPERGGSVKEVISIDDYTFNIKGVLVNEEGHFPEQEIIDLHNLFKKSNSVEMRSALSDIVLNGAYDHRVVIREIRWPAISGVEHVRGFEMDVESDQILELDVIEDIFKPKSN